MSQGDDNQWFEKEKTFTVKLDAGGETYETGSFPVNKSLSQSPTLEIVSVK